MKTKLLTVLFVISAAVPSAHAALHFSIITTAPIGVLPIPAGGFTAPLTYSVTFNYNITLIPQVATYHITDWHVDFWDVDPLSNDPIVSASGLFTPEVVANIGQTGSLSANVTLPTAALNAANDFLEGDNLELAGSGYLTYYISDEPVVPPPSIPTDPVPIPEPASTLSTALIIMSGLLLRRRIRV